MVTPTVSGISVSRVGGEMKRLTDGTCNRVRHLHTCGYHPPHTPVVSCWLLSKAPHNPMTIGQSSDVAFVKQLYFFSKGAQQLIDECFRASGRMRLQWDEVHTFDGVT